MVTIANPDPSAHPRAECKHPTGCARCSIDTAHDAAVELADLAGWGAAPVDHSDPLIVDCAYLAARAAGVALDADVQANGAVSFDGLGPYEPDHLERLRLMAGGPVEGPTDEDLVRWIAGVAAGRAKREAMAQGGAW